MRQVSRHARERAARRNPAARLLRPFLLCCALGMAARAATADTVRLAAPAYSAATQSYFNGMAKDFELANPPAMVKISVVPPADMPGALHPAAAGEQPDIAIVTSHQLVDLVQANRLEALDPLLSQEFRGRFIGAFLSSGQVGGKTYGLPVGASALALYVNRDLLQKAGVAAPPLTWDELLTDAAKLKGQGITAFGLPGMQPGADAAWYCALWSQGGALLGKDGRPVLTTPEAQRSLTLYRSMIDQGFTENDVPHASAATLEASFTAGRIAFLLAGPELISQLGGAQPRLNYGIVAPPKGVDTATLAAADQFVLLRGSKVRGTAFKFVDYLFTKTPRVELSKAEGFLPTMKSEAGDRFFTKNERLLPFVRLLPRARFLPNVPGWDAVSKAIVDALQSVYSGEAAPATALQQAELALRH